MDIIAWIIVGGLAGWVASMIMKTDASMGIPANIIVGIIGALIGGFLMSVFFNNSPNTFSIGGFIVAVVGAIILLAIVRAFTGRRATV